MKYFKDLHRPIGIMIFVLLFSCEKAEIGTPMEEVETDDHPVFYSEIILNGDKFIFEAGESELFMHTEPPADASFLFYSKIAKPLSCISGCGPSFEFLVDAESLAANIIGNEFTFPFASLPHPALGDGIFRFNMHNNADVKHSIVWNQQEMDSPLADSFSIDIDTISAVAISPIIIKLNGVGSINVLPTRLTSNGNECQFSIRGFKEGDDKHPAIELKIDNASADGIVWSNGTIGSRVRLSDAQTILSAKVSLSGGCEFLLTVEIVNPDHIMNLDLDINFSYGRSDPPQTRGARINYIDSNGNHYYSIPSGEVFIHEIEEYIPNELGNPTIQYSVVFNTMLINNDNPLDIITIDSGSARLASLKK